MRVRYRLLTKHLFYSLLCLGLLSLHGVARAQVYKSYDDEGNVVFSDKPTQGGKEVKINKPNLSDSFEIPPPPPVETPAETETETKAEPEREPATQPLVVDGYVDTNNDGRISRREREDQREARRKEKREAAKAAEEE